MNHKKVLIVDDQADNNYILQVLLEGHGFEVVVAMNGTEALHLARIHHPDLVISDLLMPVMDGFTLLRHWMQDSQLNKIPFIVYTATYREPEDEMLALSLGAKRYLLKPMEVEDVLRVVNEVLDAEHFPDLSSGQDGVAEESAAYQSYNESLIRKLEERAIVLEKANQELKDEIEQLKASLKKP